MTDQAQDQPLFILAPPRSYTSVVCAMLGQHPAMCGLPEINLFAAETVAELLDLFDAKPGLRHGILRATAQLGLGDQTADSVGAALEWLGQNRGAPTHTIFSDLAAWAERCRLVDKSPIYCLRAGSLERIEHAFPDARYLHLTRHPATTVDSLTRFRKLVHDRYGHVEFGSATPRRKDISRFWLKPHERILRFLERISEHRKRRVRGEDLLRDPAQRLEPIVDWLGLDTTAASIDAMLHPEESPFAGEGPPAARFGNDPEFLRRPGLRPPSATTAIRYDVLPADVADCARHLGYNNQDSEGNRLVSR